MIAWFFRGAAAIAFIALVCVGAYLKMKLDSAAEIEAEMTRIETRFKAMEAQHRKAIQAGESAIRARDEVHAILNGRALELEKILGSCPDVSGLCLPDSLCEFISKSCSNPPAPVISYGADPDSAPDGRENGR